MKNLILLIASIFMLQSVNAGRLQNVDFMSELELDNAGSDKTALLNDVKIYVTSIAKTLDQAILDGDIGGGGSGDSTNVLLNPKFEDEGDDWTITGGCVASYPVTAELGKTLRLTCTAATFSVKQLSTSLVPFAGQQAAFDLQVKSDANGVKVSSINNSIRNKEYEVIGDDTFKRFKQIGVIADAVNNGVETFSDVPFTGVVDFDNTYLGLSNLTQEIGNITDSISYTPISDITNATLSGTYRRVGNTLEGEVLAVFTGTPAASGSFYFGLPSGLLIDESIMQLGTVDDNPVIGNGRLIDSGTATYAGIAVRAETGSRVSGHRSGAGTNIDSTYPFTFTTGDRISYKFSVPIQGWSLSTQTIVTQDTELTAKTANTFTARIYNNTIAAETPVDWISTCTSGLTNKCTYNTGIFNLPPHCQVTANRAAITASFNDSTFNNTDINIMGYNDAGTNLTVNTEFVLTCTKAETDYNKNATIIGSFEQIESVLTELTKETSNKITISSTSSSVTTTDFGLTSDYIVTIQSSGEIKIDYSSLGLTVPPVMQITARHHAGVDGASMQSFSLVPSTTEVVGFFYNSSGNAYNPTNISWTINKQGADVNKDVKGVIISTSDHVEKCQTKILSANISSITTIADLTFNNLSIGKKYRIRGQVYGAVASQFHVRDGLNNDLARNFDGGFAQIAAINTKTFTATSTTVGGYSNVTNVIYGDGTYLSTWLELCEVSENTIITTEFN